MVVAERHPCRILKVLSHHVRNIKHMKIIQEWRWFEAGRAECDPSMSGRLVGFHTVGPRLSQTSEHPSHGTTLSPLPPFCPLRQRATGSIGFLLKLEGSSSPSLGMKRCLSVLRATLYSGERLGGGRKLLGRGSWRRSCRACPGGRGSRNVRPLENGLRKTSSRLHLSPKMFSMTLLFFFFSQQAG